MSKKLRVAILISGRGSNMVSLVKAARTPDFPAEIVLVISNRPDAAGLCKARDMGIEAIAIDHTDYPSRESFESDLHETISDHNVDLICLAGFMRILTPYFIRQWPNKILNIHPSLLPKYKGLNTHQRALDAGDKIHGCSVHFVNDELDGGEIIKQASIDIKKDDTAETLAQKLIAVEHKLYPEALKNVTIELLSKNEAF